MKRRRAKKRSERRIVLMGPIAAPSDLAVALDSFDGGARVTRASPAAVVTAGWREREGDVSRLGSCASRLDDLELFRRAEAVAELDPELAKGHKELQTRLKLLRRAYNIRLRGAVESHVELRALDGDPAVLESEQAAAIETVRSLDRAHLARVAELRDEFYTDFTPHERDAVVAEREELSARLADRTVLVIAGGHVASLLNRLRLFGLDELAAHCSIVAWSAGAMALASKVVLFHDSPPWGAGNPEAFDHGLGLAPGVLLFPRASERLRLDDPERTIRLARRFEPDTCVLLDAGDRVARSGDTWTSRAKARCLTEAGEVREFRASAA